MKWVFEKETEDFLEKEGFRVVKSSFYSSKNNLRKYLKEIGFPLSC